MPEKDGITMTEDLRANMATSHIPVVLLPAKTDMDSKLEGMEPVSYTHLDVYKRQAMYLMISLQQGEPYAGWAD